MASEYAHQAVPESKWIPREAVESGCDHYLVQQSGELLGTCDTFARLTVELPVSLDSNILVMDHLA